MFETIIPGALTLADDVVLDRHHLEFMPLASTRSGTLRCGLDQRGLWFEADLYARSGGYDVINGLRGGRSLAASFTMIDRRADRQGNLDSVTSAVVVGLALLRPGRAVYSGTRAWLADEMPRPEMLQQLGCKASDCGLILARPPSRARPLPGARGRLMP